MLNSSYGKTIEGDRNEDTRNYDLDELDELYKNYD